MTAAARESVRTDQRFTRARRCPICAGAGTDARGQEKRCHGYLSSDGAFAHCTREDHAGSLDVTASSETYAHRLAGPCGCGMTHGELAAIERPTIVATYDYVDEQSRLLFQAVRIEPKTFRQRRPDGAGGWTWKLDDTRRVIYRLPELLASDREATVFIVEGEKDVETLRAIGLVATTNPMGAGKWHAVADDAREALADRHVVVIPDADDKGRKHAADIVRSLTGFAASVITVELGDGCKDSSDWIAKGHTAADLANAVQLEREGGAGDRVFEPAAPATPPKQEPRFGTPFVAPEPPHVAILAVDAARLIVPPIRSYPTTIPQLDDLTAGGISTRQLTAVMGPPGAGKTAWAVSTSIQIAQFIPVLYGSTELELHELKSRYASPLLERPWSDIERGAIPRERVVAALDGLNVYLLGSEQLGRDGAAALKLIKAEAKRIATKHGVPPLVVIDYLQDLARGSEKDLRAKVGDIATECRVMSQELDCPMIVISAVARLYYSPRKAAELRELDDPTVYLAAAKESGDVDYASAVVLFLDVEDDRAKPERQARIAVAKSRHRHPGFAGALFTGTTGRWTPSPSAVDALSSSGRSEKHAAIKVDDADDKVFKAVARLHAEGKRDLATYSQLKVSCGIGTDRVKPALDRLVHGNRLRLVPIERMEGKTLRRRDMYEPVAPSVPEDR